MEGVSELLICYPLKREERPKREMERRYDYASAALSILPRDRYRSAWHDARREATVSVPCVPGSWTHVSSGLSVPWPIPAGETPDR